MSGYEPWRRGLGIAFTDGGACRPPSAQDYQSKAEFRPSWVGAGGFDRPRFGAVLLDSSSASAFNHAGDRTKNSPEGRLTRTIAIQPCVANGRMGYTLYVGYGGQAGSTRRVARDLPVPVTLEVRPGVAAGLQQGVSIGPTAAPGARSPNGGIRQGNPGK